MPYVHFARFYDLVMGDRSQAANFTRSLIAHHKPKTKTVLEIACGTGAILGVLPDTYEVTGLDRSRQMLAIARKKLSHIRFYRQNMTNFRIARQFDAIVCVFDSINHLLSFAAWKKSFAKWRYILMTTEFLYSTSTPRQAPAVSPKSPAWSREFDRDLVIIKVNGGRRGIFEWDVKIFEHQKRLDYRLYHEMIKRALRCRINGS